MTRITQIAKALADLIRSYGDLSSPDKLLVASGIIQFLAGDSDKARGTQGAQAVIPPGAFVPKPLQQEQDAPRRDNDPGTGSVLAPEGYECTCFSCGRVVYRTNAPIMGSGMGVNALLAALTPSEGAPALTREDLNVVKDAQGNTWIDCTLCKGEKTLRLLGDTEPEKGFPGGSV